MEGKDWTEYMNKKFSEIPQEVLSKALEVLPEFIRPQDEAFIRAAYEEKGDMWIGTHHHFWGMSCRNFLREKGLSDDLLPDGNWDDYYIQVVEAYLGLR